MKPLVIYHGNCADGFSAAWCFHHKDPKGFDFHKGVYGEEPPNVSGRHVYIVDFTYPRDTLLRMAESAKCITVIDHHQSAMKDLNNISQEASEGDYCSIEVNFDMNRSGAGMAWDYLFPNEERPAMINHVEDRDLWRFNLEGTKSIQQTVFSYEYEFDNWDKLMLADARERMSLMAQGDALYRKHIKDIKELIAFGMHYTEIGGITVPTLNVPYTMSSEAGNIMCKGHPFAACYMETGNQRVYSLRSDENGLDVSEIAKQYGGGGHKNAAGYKVKKEQP